jgi:hypothetical protein
MSPAATCPFIVEHERSRNAVGVYDRPPAWRTRRVLVPAAIFVLVAAGYAFYLLL